MIKKILDDINFDVDLLCREVFFSASSEVITSFCKKVKMAIEFFKISMIEEVFGKSQKIMLFKN